MKTFFLALFLLLLGLKLAGIIAWSWLWVASPLWAPPLASVFIAGVLALMAARAITAKDYRP